VTWENRTQSALGVSGVSANIYTGFLLLTGLMANIKSSSKHKKLTFHCPGQQPGSSCGRAGSFRGVQEQPSVSLAHRHTVQSASVFTSLVSV
jgi:hypothetical protein